MDVIGFRIFICLYSLWILISRVTGRSSPIQPWNEYDHSIVLEKDVAELWWTVDSIQQNICFEVHVKTTGWLAVGISPGLSE